MTEFLKILRILGELCSPVVVLAVIVILAFMTGIDILISICLVCPYYGSHGCKNLITIVRVVALVSVIGTLLN